MTTRTTMIVANKFERLGAFWRNSAWLKAYHKLFFVMPKWKRAMMAPSNSAPCSVLIVMGEKLFHKMISQMFVAMKREMPLPRP